MHCRILRRKPDIAQTALYAFLPDLFPFLQPQPFLKAFPEELLVLLLHISCTMRAAYLLSGHALLHRLLPVFNRAMIV
jgi:hypothetical protein